MKHQSWQCRGFRFTASLPESCSWKSHFFTVGIAFEEEDSDIEVEADTALCGRPSLTIWRNEASTTDKDVLNGDEPGKAFLVSVKKWPILVLSKCFTSVWTPATKTINLQTSLVQTSLQSWQNILTKERHYNNKENRRDKHIQSLTLNNKE